MIDIQHITKSFGTLQVLKGIDLHINKSEVVSIVGPSGAGKTTLLQIIGTPSSMASIPAGFPRRSCLISATAISASYSSSTSCCLSSRPSRTS